MTRSGASVAGLVEREPAAWPAYLAEHSGLPGPRANLALVQAVARLADPATIEILLSDGGEYQTMCAAAAAARRVDDSAFEQKARALAAHAQWRVREGVVIGLQLLGDEMPDALASTVSNWVEDPNLHVQRAAVAAVCEPRLLRTSTTAAAAIETCRRATAHLVALSVADRGRPDARSLRQALSYCWSVAVAADPEPGLAAFQNLDATDPDIARIIKENRRKQRLSALL